jgi:outer membrane lipoprotein LolB
MTRTLRKRAATLVLVPLLAACATVSPPVDQAGRAAVAEARVFQPSLTLAGRLSVNYESRLGAEALHGSFQWHQDGPQTRVVLLSPLGQALARIDSGPQGATLIQAGQPARTASDVDALAANALGWPLPVAGLREWLQGFALDASGRRLTATPRASSVMTLDGWRIDYPSWQVDENAIPRPRRIDLARRTTQAGEVAIRIVIDAWQVP